ncbi:phosphate ABC transporter substrate-binding protein PstS [Micromonospora sp. NPDC051296]|uniref:phosphate ABC transporter substrate-binding protein PstS n=1 Tax=Micromonospora sp. NPDC051296 TaxID=3155046 RepID=UPI00344400F3
MRGSAGRIGRLLRAVVAVATVGAVVLPATVAQAAPGYIPISGAGSTWSANALRQWGANVKQFNMTVNYSASGSTDGRTQFANGTVDFGVSEIQYGLYDSNFGRAADQPPAREFAYMPIVAGGTAFMYNLNIGGRRVTNLRLSGENVAKIFTGVIKFWNDPAIKADNPSLTLPARRIVPVVRADGSGTSAQFTLWLSKQYPDIWNDYCAKNGKRTPCGLTSYFPYKTSEGFVAKNGSENVSGYVRQPQGEGAITYVEYSYPKKAGFPVAKVLNKSGYYIEPTARNVAVALTFADIETTNKDRSVYLTQKLEGVYASPDKRAYPLSSYSYMILPTKEEYGLNRDRGRTLAAFGYYLLCEGQQQADSLGYSPLPKNLVEAGLQQVEKIPGVEVQPNKIKSCNNPTFSNDGTNTLAKNTPDPPECDRKGATVQCDTGTGGAPEKTPQNNGGSNGGNQPGGSNGQPGTPGGPSGGPSAGPSSGPSGGPAGGPSAGAGNGAVDPITGDPISDDPGAGNGAGGGQYVAGIPVSLEAEGGWRLSHTLMLLAGLLLAGLVMGPPLLARSLRQRGGEPWSGS